MLSNKNKTLFGLIGAGGFGREVMPFACKMFCDNADVAFIETSPICLDINNYPLISEIDFLEANYSTKVFNVAISDSRVRRKMEEKYSGIGYQPVSIIAPGVTVYDDVKIEDGAIICQNTIITSNVRIGKFFHLNINSYVAHDCIIGDFVTFAPNVACNGNVHIGNHAYIGTGAIIREGSKGAPLYIGDGAIIGMGAVVTRDVPPNATVIGNPARLLIKN